jgi:hypothetical protein
MKTFFWICLLLSSLSVSAQFSSQQPVNVMLTYPSEKAEVWVSFWGKDYKPLTNEILAYFGTPDAQLATSWTWQGRTIPGVGENLSIYIQEGHMINTKKTMTTKFFTNLEEKTKIEKKMKGNLQIIYKIEVRGDDHQTVIRGKEQAENLQSWLKSMIP